MIAPRLILALAATHLVADPGIPAYRNTAPGIRYVGTKTCATCHTEIAERYLRTAMGRSMTLGEDTSSFSRAPLPFTVFDNETGGYFEVSRNNGSLFQGAYALDGAGKQKFRQTRKIAYVIGSGENGVSFLVERDGYLFEAPLSYYTKSRTWSFSPGYERHNYAFTRLMVAECVGCHSGRPQPVYAISGLYQKPPFAELAVGCENCHGPGELHVAERRAARPLTGSIDSSIVNPAHLSGWLSDNICMKCHQGGDVRVEQPGKHDQDFRPGTQLDNVVAIFKAPLSPAVNTSGSVLLEHYFSMTLSKCYRASAGNLHCTSCHDPHSQPGSEQAAAYYRSKCLACHESRMCGLLPIERQKTNPPDDCAACHMPKRPVATITHAELTEHRVIVNNREPLPDEAFQPDGSNTGLIHLTSRHSVGSIAAPDATLFQAYSTLVHAGHEEFRSRMNHLLDRLAKTSPDDRIVLSALARREAAKSTAGSLEAAAGYFSKAINAGSTERDNFLLLAEVYSRMRKNDEALETLKQGMQTNPYSPEFAERLAARYIEIGDYRSSLNAIRRGLELFPDDMTLHNLHDKVQSALPVEGDRSQLH